MQEEGPVALVTGASRGIGAATAVALARLGFNIALNYRSKVHRAQEVAQAIETLGRECLLVQADLVNDQETAAMFALVRERFQQLDLLVLNASGGLERDKPASYAMDLNVAAQVRAVELALPLMANRHGRIVFVTSHLAHFYGQKPVPDGYEPVAVSKRAGEDALRQMQPRLASMGLSLVVVSGDLIEGTVTPRLLQRQMPGFIEARRQEAGSIPTVEEFAQAIAGAATDPSLENGATVFVGSTEW